MKKVLSIVLAMMMLVSGLAALADDFVIAYVCKDMSEQWFIDQTAAVEETCKAQGASQIIILDSDMDSEKMFNNLDNVISQKVDAIITQPVDVNLSQATADRCAAAGIPVIAMDDPMQDENGMLLAPAVALRAYDIGWVMGEWLGKYVEENNLNANPEEFGYICMYAGTISSTIPRGQGAADAITANSTVTEDRIFHATEFDGSTEKAYDIASALIVANPQIKYWVGTCTNDEGAMGIVRALESAGLDKDACVVGCGAYLAKDEFRREYSCMKAACYFSPKVAGTMVAEIVMNYLNNGVEMCSDNIEEGQTFGINYFPGVMVDPANFEEIMGTDAL